jgi:hypothetical protein
MNLFRKRNASGSTDKMHPIYFVIVALIMPFVEGARWCMDKTYSGWNGLLTVPLGLVAAFGGAFAAGNYASTAFELGTFWTSLAGIAGWLAVMFYIFPLVWRFIVKPVSDFCEAAYDRFRKVTSKYSAPFFNGIARLLGIGAGRAWDRVLSKEHEDSWFASLLGIVGHVGSFASTAYLGWQTYTWISAAVSIPVLGFSLAIAGGLAAFLLTFGLLEQLLRYGKLSFIAVASGVAAVWGAAPYLVALTGAADLWVYAVYAVSYAVFVGYLFPLVNLILTNGFWSWLWKNVKPLPEKTYDDKDEKYSEFFHHVVNFVVTAACTYGAWSVAATAGLALWAVLPIAAVTAALAYIVGFKFINHDGGNFIVGALVSLAGAYFVGSHYVAAGYVYGIYGAIMAGVLAALVTGVVLFPVAYLGVRLVLRALGASGLADPLTSLYKWANEGFKKALKQIRHAWDYCYSDKTGYKDLVLHVVNLVIAVVVWFVASAGVAEVGAAWWWAYPAVALSTLLSYLLVGKLLFKSGYGLEFVGACASLWVGIIVGQIVHGAGAGWLFVTASIVAGIATWCAVFFVAFPVAYVVARFATSWALLGWLKPVLDWFFKLGWKGFIGFWTGFLAMYTRVWEALAPVRARIAKAWRGVSETYRKILDSIRGR